MLETIRTNAGRHSFVMVRGMKWAGGGALELCVCYSLVAGLWDSVRHHGKLYVVSCLTVLARALS